MQPNSNPDRASPIPPRLLRAPRISVHLSCPGGRSVSFLIRHFVPSECSGDRADSSHHGCILQDPECDMAALDWDAEQCEVRSTVKSKSISCCYQAVRSSVFIVGLPVGENKNTQGPWFLITPSFVGVIAPSSLVLCQPGLQLVPRLLGVSCQSVFVPRHHDLVNTHFYSDLLS